MNQDLNRVCANINIDHLIENKNAIVKHLKEDTKVMAVVKSDAYGHGAVSVAKALAGDGIDYFAVAILDEAIVLREAGIKEPILVLGYTFKNQYEHLIRYNIAQAISSMEEAIALSEVGVGLNQRISIHLEIDTGMTRLGMLYDDGCIGKIREIRELEGIKLEGIFTHFSKADEVNKDYTNLQLKRFDGLVTKLSENDIEIPLIHASNSAGTIDHREAHFNLIRPGISLYGLYPSDEVNTDYVPLKPVLSLVSRIVSIKEIKKGTPISYGGTFITERPTKVGVVPVGYGDGYPRQLSSKGRVIINNQYAPILGRVCMDKFMVDLTDIDDVAMEDEVILIGEQNNLCISTEEIANSIGTINYEVICQLGKRIPRAYYKNCKIIHTLSRL